MGQTVSAFFIWSQKYRQTHQNPSHSIDSGSVPGFHDAAKLLVDQGVGRMRTAHQENELDRPPFPKNRLFKTGHRNEFRRISHGHRVRDRDPSVKLCAGLDFPFHDRFKKIFIQRNVSFRLIDHLPDRFFFRFCVEIKKQVFSKHDRVQNDRLKLFERDPHRFDILAVHIRRDHDRPMERIFECIGRFKNEIEIIFIIAYKLRKDTDECGYSAHKNGAGSSCTASFKDCFLL